MGPAIYILNFFVVWFWFCFDHLTIKGGSYDVAFSPNDNI